MASNVKRERLQYVPSTYGAEPIQMDGRGVYVGTGGDLRGRKWEYTLGSRSLSAVARKAREVSVDAWFLDEEACDELRRAADRDIATGSPGELVLDGVWRQKAYITASDPGSVGRGWHSASLTAVLLDGVWRKAHDVFVERRADEVESDYLDMGYDCPYDLSPTSLPTRIDGAEFAESPIKLTVYGPAESPYIVIGDNRYQVDASVPAGSRLVIDGASWPRSITLVGPDGSEADLFSAGHRGTGQGGGEYVFEPLPAGTVDIQWPGSFAFTLTWYEEEGEWPWSSS